MNKTKMMLAATGGAIGLAVLVMAYFTWSAFSAKTAALEGDDEEGIEGLEAVLSRARSLSRKPVYPCIASLKAIESNQTVLVEWREEAMKLARRGDRIFEKTTPAAFKEFLVSDAKRLAALPGASATSAVMKPEFAFGPFKDYISGGKMPADSELVGLQRRWDDVATVIEILSQSGITELTGVDFANAAEQGKGKSEQDEKGKKKNKKPVRKSTQTIKQANNPTINPISHSYVFFFTTKPAAFVKALNAFVICERFVTVENFSFSRQKDAIADALGGEEKSTGTASPGRRRRRGASAEEKKTDDENASANGLVTDPSVDASFAVVLTVNVRDFRSLEEDKTEEVQK